MIQSDAVLQTLARDVLIGAVRLGGSVLIIKPESVGYQALVQSSRGLYEHRYKELKRDNADAIVYIIQNLVDARQTTNLVKQGKYKLEDGDLSYSVEIISVPPLVFSDYGEKRPTLLIFIEER
jgi:hypothetical protein